MRKSLWKSAKRLLTYRSLALLSAAALAVSLAPLFLLSFYNHPCSDDYNFGLYAAQAVRSGGSLADVLAAAGRKTAETYQNWQGTFSAVFLMSLHPAVFSEQLYAITGLIMLGSLLFSTFFLLKVLLVEYARASRSCWVIAGCLVSFFSIQMAPSAFEGFYWFNGSVFYTFFYSLSLCLYAFVLKFFRAPSRKAAAWDLIAALLLAFFLGGGNYPTALLTLVLLTLAAAGTFLARLPLSRKIGVLACLLLEAAAFLISIVAPGNAVRQEECTNRLGAVNAIFTALLTAVQTIMDSTTLPLLLALLALVPAFCSCTSRLSFRFPCPLLAPLAAICILGVEMTPPLYAMGGTGAARIQDLYHYTYCLLAVLTVFYLCGWFTHRCSLSPKLGKNGQTSSAPAITLAVLALFCAAFLCLPQLRSVNGISAFISLKNGEAQTYHREMMERLEQYQDPTIDDVVVEPITARPALFPSWLPGVTADPDYASNQRIAKFYGKNSIRERTE